MKNALFWYPHLFFGSTGRSFIRSRTFPNPGIGLFSHPPWGESYKLQTESLVGVSVEKEPQTAFLRCFFAVPVSSDFRLFPEPLFFRLFDSRAFVGGARRNFQCVYAKTELSYGIFKNWGLGYQTGSYPTPCLGYLLFYITDS